VGMPSARRNARVNGPVGKQARKQFFAQIQADARECTQMERAASTAVGDALDRQA